MPTSAGDELRLTSFSVVADPHVQLRTLRSAPPSSLVMLAPHRCRHLHRFDRPVMLAPRRRRPMKTAHLRRWLIAPPCDVQPRTPRSSLFAASHLHRFARPAARLAPPWLPEG